MSALTDKQLKVWASFGGVIPYDEAMINPASIDLRWSGRYRKSVYAPERWSAVQELEGLTMHQGVLYLLDTVETVTMPDDAAGFLMLKSSSGRKGLEHLHAGLFDPGFSGTATLEMENRHPYPVTIKKGQPIIQLCLVRTESIPLETYQVTGRYNGQAEPQVAIEGLWRDDENTHDKS